MGLFLPARPRVGFALTIAFFLLLLVPLKGLFFCLVEELTRGIVDDYINSNK